MSNEKSTSPSILNSRDEDDNITPDYELDDPYAITPPAHHLPNLMQGLNLDEELSDDRISELMLQFVSEFTNRYSTCGPSLSMGSLDQALVQSLYDQQNARPLILFLYHGRSVSANIFCEQVLCTNDIKCYIKENFIVWAWDRTNDINYQRLLKMIQECLGNQIDEKIVSLLIDEYPVLICLAYSNGRVQITHIIQGNASHDYTLELLKEAYDRFDTRIETPHSADPLWTLSINETWSMSPSIPRHIENSSEEFERIANTYARQSEHVNAIEKIENSSWFSQYLDQKASIRGRRGNDQIEDILVYPCSQVCAQYILKYGFNNDHKVKTYHRGLHVQSAKAYQKNYSSSYSVKDHPDALLVCRVLVGQSCHKDEIIRTSPFVYDSTTDGLGTYIVNSNRSILPIYYIKYKN